MAETKIEWADFTFNPWIGCTKVSPACDHCYAEALARRYGWAKWGAGEERQLTSEANWKKPLAWDRAAKAAGVRRRVFCASLADIFDNEVPDAWRGELFESVIEKTPNLDWLLLTKRPQVAKKWAQPMPDNVWLGTTVENQPMADLRIPILLSIKATRRFLSMEPLLELVDIERTQWIYDETYGSRRRMPVIGWSEYDRRKNAGIDWVICGGESGPGARDMHQDWARNLRDQCKEAGVWFFMKQMARKAPIPDDLMVREFPT